MCMSYTQARKPKVKPKVKLKVKPKLGNSVDLNQKQKKRLKTLKTKNHAAKTKKNTQWGLKIFQDWHLSVHGDVVYWATVDEGRLYNLLRKFYCEVAPQEKKTKSTEPQPKVYHKNTMKNIRAALNRHLSDIGSNIENVHGQMFKSANRTLNGLLKIQMLEGLSLPTEHKSIISKGDLSRLADYISKAETTTLRHAVWYNLAIHFVRRGLEFHQQLKRDSFEFLFDEDGLQ